MIRRLFTLLLIFLMLANQGLCLSHTHHGNGIAEPEDHGVRPHIHIGGHDHHKHHHGDHSHAGHSHSESRADSDEHDVAFPPTCLPVDDHDSDAVYLGERVTTARRSGSSETVHPEKDVAGSSIVMVANQCDRLGHCGPIRGQPPSVFDTDFPIYLRVLSLRI